MRTGYWRTTSRASSSPSSARATRWQGFTLHQVSEQLGQVGSFVHRAALHSVGEERCRCLDDAATFGKRADSHYQRWAAGRTVELQLQVGPVAAKGVELFGFSVGMHQAGTVPGAAVVLHDDIAIERLRVFGQG